MQGFRVQGCRVQGLGFRGLGFKGLGFRVLGFKALGFRASARKLVWMLVADCSPSVGATMRIIRASWPRAASKRGFRV